MSPSKPSWFCCSENNICLIIINNPKRRRGKVWLSGTMFLLYHSVYPIEWPYSVISCLFWESSKGVLVTEMIKLMSNSIHFDSQSLECFYMADRETSMPNLTRFRRTEKWLFFNKLKKLVADSLFRSPEWLRWVGVPRRASSIVR